MSSALEAFERSLIAASDQLYEREAERMAPHCPAPTPPRGPSRRAAGYLPAAQAARWPAL